jgi:1A family penicillin-binding protein
MGLLIVAGVILTVVFFVSKSLAAELETDLAKLQALDERETFESTQIYSHDGELLYEILEEGRRTEVPLERIPIELQQAVIAAEDDTFYENPGFDAESIIRAAYQWFTEGEIVSGGSTITQQLVRHVAFSYEERTEQTLRRKLKEAALAWTLTRQRSKDEILGLYLNEIYYGNLAYGIEAAAQTYFDKHASDLTLAESTFLAGLPNAPAELDPFTNLEAAKARQRVVLDLMVLHGYLTQAEADAAYDEPLEFADPDVPLVAPHFVVEVRRELEARFGPEMVARGGLSVTTTLDMGIQRLAEEIAAEQIAEVGDEFNLHNAALVAIKPTTGEVLAMLGSVDYNDETIDGRVNVALSPQQPGSAMKPFTYAAALEQGHTPADVLWDVPVKFTGAGGDVYAPHNYDGRFHGPVRVRDALANSYNVPAVLMLRDVGVENLLEMSRRLGIESLGDDPSQYGLSLTLGGGELTPLEITAAYGVFAGGGYRAQPRLIERVTDSSGKVLYEAGPSQPERVLDGRIAFIISDILSDNAARTPAMGAASDLLLPFTAAAKTGTTNDFRDNWTIGYTANLVVGVWAGNTDNSPMAEGTSGLTGAAPIWNRFMQAVYDDPALRERLEITGVGLVDGFPVPSGLESRPVCVLSSLKDPARAVDGCSQTRPEWFLQTPAAQYEPGEGLYLPEPTPQPTPTEASPMPEGEFAGPPPVEQFDVGIWKMAVLPLPPELQAALMSTASNGEPTPPPPLYCIPPQSETGRPEADFRLFIEAPEFPDEAVSARVWAREHGVPIAPDLSCDVQTLTDLLEPGEGDDLVATWLITEPGPWDKVSGVIPIVGTAYFRADQVQFYKIELGVGPAPSEWMTLGETHSEPVIDGTLEMLHADALSPGIYVIRLVLVRHDGNFPRPYAVPIEVVPTVSGGAFIIERDPLTMTRGPRGFGAGDGIRTRVISLEG